MSLLERCRWEFGTTENPINAAFILSDGALLDFSEKGGYEGRVLNHTDIGLCFPENYPVRYGSYLKTFIEDTNSIRVSISHPYYKRHGCSVNAEFTTGNKPTKAQIRRLEELELECEEFYYDVTKAGGGYCETPVDPPPTLKKALRDLKRCRRQ